MDGVFFGDIVLEDEIMRGTVSVSNGLVAALEPCGVCPSYARDLSDGYIAPGFVDIHCHAGGDTWAYDDPAAVAAYHREHGTVAMLLTLYRTLSQERTLTALQAIAAAKECAPNILGAHLEGPYLNPDYGSKSVPARPVVRDEYMRLLDTGVVRQWTFSPEMPGTADFLEDIAARGIVPAIGHSAASPEQVFYAAEHGARIVTHIMDATGASVTPTRWAGTRETGFDEAALLCDGLYCEVICDRGGVHLRPEMLRLIIKTAGLSRVVAITDCCAGGPPDSDVNIVDGELMGSRMTMDGAARNLLALGLTVPQVFRVTALNGARAIGADDLYGSVAPGKLAALIHCSCALDRVRVL